MPLTGPILPSSKCLKETVWPNHACKCEAKHRDTRKSDRRHHQVYCESHEDSRHHIYQPKQFVSNHSTRHGLSYRSVRRRHSHFRTTHATSDALKSPSSHKECIAVDWFISRNIAIDTYRTSFQALWCRRMCFWAGFIVRSTNTEPR